MIRQNSSLKSESVTETNIGFSDQVLLPRYNHGMIKTANEEEIYVFGGLVSDVGKRCNQLWKYSVQDEKWELVEVPGTVKHNADNLFTIESKHSQESLTKNDSTVIPAPRSGFGMTYDEDFNSIIIFGGRTSKKAYGDNNDLWEFSIESSTWKCISKDYLDKE